MTQLLSSSSPVAFPSRSASASRVAVILARPLLRWIYTGLTRSRPSRPEGPSKRSQCSPGGSSSRPSLGPPWWRPSSQPLRYRGGRPGMSRGRPPPSLPLAANRTRPGSDGVSPSSTPAVASGVGQQPSRKGPSPPPGHPRAGAGRRRCLSPARAAAPGPLSSRSRPMAAHGLRANTANSAHRADHACRVLRLPPYTPRGIAPSHACARARSCAVHSSLS